MAHSLHAYFIRSGDAALPVEYQVFRDFDGRSFSKRSVIGSQGGSTLLTMTASFQEPEAGFHHQVSAPDVPGPETAHPIKHLASREGCANQNAVFDTGGIEFRRIVPNDQPEPDTSPVKHSWFRFAGPLPDDPALHQAILAFASDMTLLGSSLKPHGVDMLSPGMQAVSLDHSLWFHDAFRADEWLLYAMNSPWAGNSRGFVQGQIFTQDGRLVASVAQEGLIRLNPGRRA